MDKWQELTIEVNREVEEAASNILIESGSQGVAIDDSADYLENADRFLSFILRLNRLRRLKLRLTIRNRQISRLLLSRLMSVWLS